MARLTAVILLIIAAAAVASASSSYRYRGDKCEKEVEEQMPMKRCMMWAQSKMRGPYKYNDAMYKEEEEEHLEECCSELRELSSGCRCSAVKEMMMEIPQLEMKRMMCSLPTRCGMTTACACPRRLVA